MSFHSDYKSHRCSDGNSTITTTSHRSMDHNHARRNKTFPVREDFWSIDSTFTLITAWGEKFLQLNRGNLRQKHWLDVADAVNLRHGKTHRTDVQCKNRMDTLKKKYKSEKCRVLESGYVSQWPFFKSLDSLIGSNFKPKRTPPALPLPLPLPPSPSSVPVGLRSKRSLLQQPSTDNNNSLYKHSFSLMAAAAAAIDDPDEDSDTSSSGGGPVEKEDEDPLHELAEAIGRFADVYERVEEAKQRQMVELEKQRMCFIKDLELQRMKLLIESQVQLEQQLKRFKTTTSNDSEPYYGRNDEGNHSASISRGFWKIG